MAHFKRAKRDEDKYYESAASYDALHKEEQLRKIHLIIKEFPFSKEESLLDVGCGTGFSLKEWPVREVTGAEPSSMMLRHAPHELHNKILHIRAEDMSVLHDNEFDIVVSITAIHNFVGIETGLLEMKRIGKRKFVFSVLKKSEKAAEIEQLIKKHFTIRKVLDDQHDRIYLIY